MAFCERVGLNCWGCFESECLDCSFNRADEYWFPFLESFISDGDVYE